MHQAFEIESKPKQYHVAVVIPARDRPDLLEECLSSLAKQDFPLQECEILICDDGSTWDLQPGINKFVQSIPHLRTLKQKAKGPAAARNLGFRSSKADIFVCVDSDIICEKDFLRRIIRALEFNLNWVAAQGRVLPKGNIDSLLFDAPRSDGHAYLSGATAYRADALIRAGGFDEMFPFPACEDAELAARLLQFGEYGYVHEAVVYHPSRPVTFRTHWQWGKFWRYVTTLAVRYGFLAFPGRNAGRLPRFRVAMAALLTQPGGRLLEACKYTKRNFREGILASLYALFDVICGLSALPAILFSTVPPRRNYLEEKTSPEQNFSESKLPG